VEVAKWKTVRAEELDDGRLLRVTLDAGKGNVIGGSVIRELREVLALMAPAAGLRALVLDHAGPHFSFGASVEEHAPGLVRDMLPELHALARDLLATHLPILACVRGACLGGGLELAALAHRIFAAPDARLGQPESQLGVFAPLGSLLLPQIVGPARAADLLLSGRAVDAQEALAMGLVAEIADDPLEAALAWARAHLVPKSAASLRFVTRALRATFERRLLDGLAELERVYLDELMLQHDAREGIAAFLEKRRPAWEDR